MTKDEQVEDWIQKANDIILKDLNPEVRDDYVTSHFMLLQTLKPDKVKHLIFNHKVKSDDESVMDKVIEVAKLKQNKINILTNEKVIELCGEDEVKSVKLESGKNIPADAVIICTGSEPNKLGLENEDKLWSNGISSCAVCDGALYKNKKRPGHSTCRPPATNDQCWQRG